MNKEEKRNATFVTKLLQNKKLTFKDILNHYANFLLDPQMLGEIEIDFSSYSLSSYIVQIGWDNFRILLTAVNHFVDFEQTLVNQFDFNKTSGFKEKLDDFFIGQKHFNT